MSSIIKALSGIIQFYFKGISITRHHLTRHMQIPVRQGLSSMQKWRLATGIVLAYLPVRIYISNPVLSTDLVLNKTPLWFIEFLVNIVFFRIWIFVIEYIDGILESLQNRFTLKLPAQSITFIAGVGLAIVFNTGFKYFWLNMESAFRQQFHVIIQRTEAERTPFNRQQKSKANTALTVMAMLTTIYMVSSRRVNQRLEQVRLQAERLEREKVQSQLSALKNQLSPHFLFNSFSILSSLIEKDPEKSVIYVGRLAKSYRFILEQSGFASITLKKELDFIEIYTFLLQARFGEKLKVCVDVPLSIQEKHRIAPLTLQLLVENAVKHNQMSHEHPLCIMITVFDAFLVVSNPIQLRQLQEASTGVGLTNIVNRYQLLSEKAVNIAQSDGRFTVKIPLLT
jgi:two-component system LytT family sensor kinase